MHIELNKSPEIAYILAFAAGPHNEKTAELLLFTGPKNLDSNWSEGFKIWWTLIDLENKNVMSLPECGGTGQAKPYQLNELPPNIILIECSSFGGKAMPARIHMRADNMTKFLHPATELTEMERTILSMISSFTSAYRKESIRNAGISEETYRSVKQSLYEKNLIMKNGAITVAGRNALGK